MSSPPPPLALFFMPTHSGNIKRILDINPLQPLCQDRLVEFTTVGSRSGRAFPFPPPPLLFFYAFLDGGGRRKEEETLQRGRERERV